MQLIRVSKNELGQQTVSARDLWKFLDVNSDFSTWIRRRVEKYGFIENEDFIIVSLIPQKCEIKRGGDRKSFDYIISLDMAKELAMIENNLTGKTARKYFIQCEKKYRKLIDERHLKELQKLQENDRAEFYLKKIRALENNYEEVQKLVRELYEESEILKETLQKFNSRCTWLSLLAGQGKRLIKESHPKEERFKIVG